MYSATVLYNPSAGRFPAGPLIHRATQVLSNAGWQIQMHETKGGDDLIQQARHAVEQKNDVVFVAGGDGSVGKVASVLVGTETALAVLPSGTANVWAKEMGLRHLDWVNLFALDRAAELLSSGEIRLADVGECNGRMFLLWAGIGLDGAIIHSIEPRASWMKIMPTAHFAAHAIWNSAGWEGMDLHVVAPGIDIQGTFLVAIVSNIRAYAGGYVELAPTAKVDDGMLDFWLFEGTSLKDVVKHVYQVWKGVHVSAKGVFHFKSSEATFSAKGSFPLQFDGEPMRVDLPVRFSVRPKVLRVLVPAKKDLGIFLENQTE